MKFSENLGASPNSIWCIEPVPTVGTIPVANFQVCNILGVGQAHVDGGTVDFNTSIVGCTPAYAARVKCNITIALCVTAAVGNGAALWRGDRRCCRRGMEP